MHSFTSPHDISWMVVCRHRVFPKSVIGLAQLFLATVVIRYETKATARWASLLIVRAFFDNTITVAGGIQPPGRPALAHSPAARRWRPAAGGQWWHDSRIITIWASMRWGPSSSRTTT